MKTKVKVLKSFHQFEEGEVYEFKDNVVKALLKDNWVELLEVEEPKKPRGRKSKTEE